MGQNRTGSLLIALSRQVPGSNSHALHLWQAVMWSSAAELDMLLIQKSSYSHKALHLVLLSWTL